MDVMKDQKIGKFAKTILLCTIFAFMVLCNSSQVLAAKDVTSKLKNDKGIKWLTKNLTYYGVIEHERGNITNKKKTVKMDATNKYSIAAILAANKYNKYDYNDYKNHKYKDNSLWMPKLNTGYANNLYKKLYGSDVNFTKVKSKSGYILRSGNKCYVACGDFGAVLPKYSIKKITKNKKGIYNITAKVKLKYDDPDWNTTLTVGTMWITVKKDKKAAYGYKVKKLSYSIK